MVPNVCVEHDAKLNYFPLPVCDQNPNMPCIYMYVPIQKPRIVPYKAEGSFRKV